MPRDLSLDLEALFAPVAGYTTLGLAVSGGPDSLALMLLAAEWAKPRGTRLVVYSVDHRLRPEAAGEAAMVMREAGVLGLEARVLSWEGDKPATGLQAAARGARYRMIAAAMVEDDVAILLTAHHMGDQAETVLMRMAHGSGIDGLRGMDALSFVEGCEIYRPLLGVHPAVLEEVVSRAGLTPARDPSNLDADYERVRWRQTLPALEALGLTVERLATLAQRMGAASDHVAESAEANFPTLVSWDDDGAAALPHGRLAILNPLVAGAIVSQVLTLVSGNRRPIPLGALESLVTRLAFQVPLKPETLHGCLIASDGDMLRIRPEPPRGGARKLREKAISH